ncbi:Elongation of very long chain fatty acids protein 6, partial [Melipona quadrifasciata]
INSYDEEVIQMFKNFEYGDVKGAIEFFTTRFCKKFLQPIGMLNVILVHLAAWLPAPDCWKRTGADVNVEDSHGITPLLLAGSAIGKMTSNEIYKYNSVVQTLVQGLHQTSFTLIQVFIEPLHTAFKLGCLKAAETLLNVDPPLNKCKKLRTVLYFAASVGITQRYLTHNPVSSFSLWIFTIMKLIEFGDTVFIVLRKQPLIFLHWYHHITVFLCTWHSFGETIGFGSWFSLVNTFIHSYMYSYYALKAMQVRIPKWISIMLTVLQIVQMFWGMVITTSAYYYVHIAQIQCNVTTSNLKFSALMYLSYLILFVNFFAQSYLSNKCVNKAERKNEIKTQ